MVIYPGVREFVHEAALHYRLAIASGALRHEIDFVLEQVGLKKEFEHITSAEDVVHEFSYSGVNDQVPLHVIQEQAGLPRD